MGITCVATCSGGYSDLKAVAAAIGTPKAVFWYVSGMTFYLYVLMDNQETLLFCTVGGSASPPMGFSTDFPTAVALTGLLHWDGII